MSDVLTTAATMTCPHAATVTLSGSEALTIGAVSIMTGTDLTSAAVAACPGVSASSIPPCKTVSATGGLATVLTVGGQPVVLSGTSIVTNNGPANGTITITAPPGALTSA
jgi:hypothetical protein